jgi:hypothetical protein
MRTALLAALITLGQIGFFLSAAPGPALRQRYFAGFKWDSVWYADIARRGYVSTIPPVPNGLYSNVTHFPAYPMAIRAVRSFGIDDRVASLVTAELCAWGFWLYVLLMLKRWSLDAAASALVVMAIAAHPTAFFLITAYAEPMFMMAAFGCWFWSLRSGTLATVLSAAHGFVLTATRITGALAAGAPLVAAAIGQAPRRQARSEMLRGTAITALSLCGALLFFAFCAWRFGAWNFYEIRQRVGWGNQADYLAAFYPSVYRLFVPDWHDEAQLGAFENPYVLAAIIIYAVIWAQVRKPVESLSIMLMAAAVLYLSICALYHTGFPSMARYQFPIHAMIVMSYADVLRSGRGAPDWLIGMGAAVLVGLALGSLSLQWDLASMFARGLRIL